MTVAVRVQVKVTGRRRRGLGHDLALALPPGPVTARQLVEAAVAAEIAAYQARAGEASLVRVLTEEGLRDDLAQGVVRMGGVEGVEGFEGVAPPEPVDTAAAVRTALCAFDDGIFKVFVGDREAEGSAPVDLADGAEVLFLRLMPLAGG